jgi:hypothetical protein
MIEQIKKAALEANNAGKPSDCTIGTVTGTDPLRIAADQKLELDEDQLILCRNVTDYTVDMTVAHQTEPATVDLTTEQTAHSHGIPAWDTQAASFDASHTHAMSSSTVTGSANPPTNHAHDIPAHSTASAGIKGENIGEHIHDYTGRKTFLVHNALQTGEKVILIRAAGGQKFYVIDRLGVTL